MFDRPIPIPIPILCARDEMRYHTFSCTSYEPEQLALRIIVHRRTSRRADHLHHASMFTCSVGVMRHAIFGSSRAHAPSMTKSWEAAVASPGKPPSGASKSECGG
eukprot:scaffold81907_cov39-Tisochrysis_lutea.AAC.1